MLVILPDVNLFFHLFSFENSESRLKIQITKFIHAPARCFTCCNTTDMVRNVFHAGQSVQIPLTTSEGSSMGWLSRMINSGFVKSRIIKTRWIRYELTNNTGDHTWFVRVENSFRLDQLFEMWFAVKESFVTIVGINTTKKKKQKKS